MLGLGIIGMRQGKLCASCETVHGSAAALAMYQPLDDKQAVAAFVPPMQICNTHNLERMYIIDHHTRFPRFSPMYWTTNGREIHSVDRDRACVLAPGVVPSGRHPYIRYGAHIFNGHGLWMEARDVGDVKELLLDALVPIDDVEHYHVDERLDELQKLGEPLDAMPAVLPWLGKQGEKYRIRAKVPGIVTRMTLSSLCVKERDGRSFWIPRLHGLQYSVGIGQSVKAGQLLFSAKTAPSNSNAYKAMISVLNKRMFRKIGEQWFVRLGHVKAFKTRCPLCFAELGGERCPYCANKNGKSVAGLTMVKHLRFEAGRCWLNYTGDPAALETAVPSVFSVPSVVAAVRGVRKRHPERNLVDNSILVC